MQREESVVPKLTKARKLIIPTSVITRDQLNPYADAGGQYIEILNPKLLKIILPYLTTLKPVRGDWVFLDAFPRYRNDGCFMYDGQKLVDLHTDFISYGIPHPDFEVINEFPINYWDDVNGHNNSVWFNPSKYLTQIRASKQPYIPAYEEMEEPWYHSTFTGEDGVIYNLYYTSDNNLIGKQIWQNDCEDVYRGEGNPVNSLFWQHRDLGVNKNELIFILLNPRKMGAKDRYMYMY